MCNTYVQMKFKTTMLKSSLCDYSDAYTIANETILEDQYMLMMQIND